jgi:hypothetical protein
VKPGITVSAWRSAWSTSTRCSVAQQGQQAVDLVAQPQAHVGRHLVVAAAPGVQALARQADELGETRLDVQVHVLQRQLPFEGAGFDLGRDGGHAAADLGPVLGADQALCLEHLGVRQAALDVGTPQALVEADAGGVALHQLAHRFGKQGGPGLGLVGQGVGGRRHRQGRAVRERGADSRRLPSRRCTACPQPRHRRTRRTPRRRGCR